ncbi:hypothetical protein ES703_97264 [subsurface metagenome]
MNYMGYTMLGVSTMSVILMFFTIHLIDDIEVDPVVIYFP